MAHWPHGFEPGTAREQDKEGPVGSFRICKSAREHFERRPAGSAWSSGTSTVCSTQTSPGMRISPRTGVT
jgi:hypothetical protein